MPAVRSRIKRQIVDFAPVSRDLAKLVASAARQAIAQYEPPAEAVRPKSLKEWSRHFIPEAFQCESTSEMHEWLYEQLVRCDRERGQRIGLEAPRGNSKSGITQAYVLRSAVESRESYIWIISDTKEQAQRNLDFIREELEDNVGLASAYPEATGKGKPWSGSRIKLRNGVVIEAYGMGQKLRGRKRRAARPTLIICDDLQNDNVQTSSIRRDKELRWFNDVVLKAGTRRTNIVVVGTSLHREAIAPLLRKRAGWRTRAFAAIKQWPTNMELWTEWAAIYSDRAKWGDKAIDKAKSFYEERKPEMDAGAEVLWPEWESLYELFCQRESDGHISFEREKQSNPITPETCYFLDEWFGDRIWFDKWPTERVKAWMVALDPSIGDSDASDFSAYCWGCLTLDNIIYVDASIVRRPLTKMVDDGIDIWQAVKPLHFIVEKNQFQAALPAMFSKRCLERGILLPGAKAVHNSEKKEIRVRRLEPYLAASQIRFKRSAGASLLVEQLRQFPGGKYDDGPDALELLIWGFLTLKSPAPTQRRKAYPNAATR